MTDNNPLPIREIIDATQRETKSLRQRPVSAWLERDELQSSQKEILLSFMSEQPICVGCESTFEGGYSGTTVGYAD
jgi:hypothetical protein